MFSPICEITKNISAFKSSGAGASDWRLSIDHEGNRAKTDNKYREYGAFGCAGIYSGIPPYTQVVTDLVTGYLVENIENAWLLALNELIQIRQHEVT